MEPNTLSPTQKPQEPTPSSSRSLPQKNIARAKKGLATFAQCLTPSAREAWIQALRSGKYKQGRNQLKDSKGHCCLGVLAECNGLTGWNPQHATLESHVLAPILVDPEEVSAQAPAIILNDIAEFTFQQIADLIEEAAQDPTA